MAVRGVYLSGRCKKSYGVRDSNPPLLLFLVEGNCYTP